eukprot:176089-Pelagomonas_calceolata.AAC.1
MHIKCRLCFWADIQASRQAAVGCLPAIPAYLLGHAAPLCQWCSLHMAHAQRLRLTHPCPTLTTPPTHHAPTPHLAAHAACCCGGTRGLHEVPCTAGGDHPTQAGLHTRWEGGQGPQGLLLHLLLVPAAAAARDHELEGWPAAGARRCPLAQAVAAAAAAAAAVTAVAVREVLSALDFQVPLQLLPLPHHRLPAAAWQPPVARSPVAATQGHTVLVGLPAVLCQGEGQHAVGQASHQVRSWVAATALEGACARAQQQQQ